MRKSLNIKQVRLKKNIEFDGPSKLNPTAVKIKRDVFYIQKAGFAVPGMPDLKENKR